jgi:RNA polymerase sigma factor (sigma-70 family)
MRRSSDERLVRRAKKGDRRAFEAIFERYHQDLYRFCLTMVGDRQDAEDALQATMVKLMRALPGEAREIQLRPWIYRIARNEAIDTIRRRRETVGIVPEQVAAGPGIIETAESRERLGRLIDDLRELPERQRAALVMRELGDLEFGEIGSALETSAEAARQAVYEARVSLRQMEAGREMSCDQVVWAISEADGRVVRKREIQTHLRSCPDCRAFQHSIARRRGELRAIAPLPLAASAAVLQGALGAGSGATGAGLAGTAGAGAGKAVLGSTFAKTAATCAVVAAIGTTAADRSGLVHVPIGDSPRQSAESSGPAPAVGGTSTPSTSQRGVAVHSAARSRTESGDDRNASAENRGRGAGLETAPTGAAPGGNPAATPVPAPEVAKHDAGKAAKQAAGGAAKSKKNAAKRGQGKAPGLPPSSAHGQQTSAGHKSPHANTSPGTPQGAERAHSSNPQPRSESKVQPGSEAKAPFVKPVTETPAPEMGENSAKHASGEQPEIAETSE